jgi:3-hydroxyisobutyrate dehydrogenase-like beta-hydroxyacid dehydrogenase
MEPVAIEGPVGIVGLGLVGKALARRLHAAGHRVVGLDSNPEANAEARAFGVNMVDDLQSVADHCDVVFLSLPDSTSVDAVLWGSAGLAAACAPDALILDTTTAEPKETVRHFHLLADRGVRFVDCPLVGSSREIGDGKAIAIVGDREDGAEYAPLLHTFAKRVFFLGSAGRGHTAKLVVNLVLGLHRVVLSEGLGLANRCDLDLGQALEILKASAAYSEVMETQGEVMLSRDFTRPSARLAQHAKDVGLILELAAQSGARVPLSQLHRSLLQEAIAAEWGGLDNAAVFNLFVPP